MRLLRFASILLILSSSVSLFAAEASGRPYLALGDSAVAVLPLSRGALPRPLFE